MTTPTRLPIPSNNLLDSKFNFEKLDQIVNSDANYYVDRFGNQRLTIKGLELLVEQIQGSFRDSIGLSDGFSWIGEGNYSDIRSYSGNALKMKCYGVLLPLDGGMGTFRRDDSDMTTPDNGCTVIVDAKNRRWKRDFVGNIKGEWAGIKTTDQTSDAQDDAFDRCLLAASAGIPSGYPQRIIEMPVDGTVKLNRLHYIRCGVFKESDDYAPTKNLGTRFGIIGKFALDGPGGFFVVQANSPYFNLQFDNGDLSYTTTPTVSNNALRLEAMVMNPEIHIEGQNYPGTCLYSKGKGSASEVSAIWSDLTATLPSIQNLNYMSMRTNGCGRGFYLENTGSGLGHVDSIWEQLNVNPSVLKQMYDVSIKSYEDFVAPLSLAGGMIIDTCGTVTISDLLIGSGGGPHLRIWDTPTVSIKRIFDVLGAPLYSETNPNAYGFEICNSRLNIGSIDTYYPGEFLRTGFNAHVNIGQVNGWYFCRFSNQTNDPTKLQYNGSRIGQVNDVSVVKIMAGNFYNLNYKDGGYAAQSLFYVDPTVLNGKLTINNVEFYNTHSGWDAATPEANTYMVEVRSQSPTFLFTTTNCKWDDNNFNYVIFLAKQSQLGQFQSNQTNFCRIRYGDGTQSTYGMRDADHLELGNTSPILLTGANFQYPYRRPAKYHAELVVPASSSAVVKINGQTIYNFTTAGTHNINLLLYFQEIATITITGTTTLVNSSWKYTS